MLIEDGTSAQYLIINNAATLKHPQYAKLANGDAPYTGAPSTFQLWIQYLHRYQWWDGAVQLLGQDQAQLCQQRAVANLSSRCLLPGGVSAKCIQMSNVEAPTCPSSLWSQVLAKYWWPVRNLFPVGSTWLVADALHPRQDFVGLFSASPRVDQEYISLDGVTCGQQGVRVCPE